MFGGLTRQDLNCYKLVGLFLRKMFTSQESLSICSETQIKNPERFRGFLAFSASITKIHKWRISEVEVHTHIGLECAGAGRIFGWDIEIPDTADVKID